MNTKPLLDFDRTFARCILCKRLRAIGGRSRQTGTKQGRFHNCFWILSSAPPRSRDDGLSNVPVGVQDRRCRRPGLRRIWHASRPTRGTSVRRDSGLKGQASEELMQGRRVGLEGSDCRPQVPPCTWHANKPILWTAFLARSSQTSQAAGELREDGRVGPQGSGCRLQVRPCI